MAHLATLVEGVASLLLLAEVGIVCASVVFRYGLKSPLVWSNEAAQLLLIWLSFLGAAVSYRRRTDLRMLYFVERSHTGRQWIELVSDLLVVAFGVALVTIGIPTARAAAIEYSPALGIPLTVFLGSVPVFGGLLALFGVDRLAKRWRTRLLPILAAGGGLGLLAVGGMIAWAHALRPAALELLALAFGLCLGLGVPISIAFGIASAVFIALNGAIPPSVLPSRMEAGVDNFVLLAVPLFILVGALMNAGGISERIIAFLRAVVGRFRGGLGLAMIAGMYLFSGISGSKTADMAAIGPVLVPYMERWGYTRGDAVAILSASAAMGETVPPSIAVILIGSITGLSIGALFTAGLLPAFVTALALAVLVYGRARIRRYRLEPSATVAEIVRRLTEGLAPLMLPVILLGGIVGGVATPTEVSGIAVVYGLFVAFLYRALRGRNVWSALGDSSATSGAIMAILSTANVLSWILANEGLGDALTRWLASIAHAPTVFVLFTVAVMVVMGAAMEGFPALILLAPLLLPIGAHLGLVPLHYGILLVVAMGVGVFSPPLGVGLYIACAICRATVEETIREYLPYYLVLLVALLVIAFVPQVTLAIPEMLHLSLR